jgi:hypothetical protein
MRKIHFAIAFLSFVGCLLASSAAPVAFTYQGRLFNSGDPVDGLYTMTFKAFDSLTGGTQVGSTVTVSQAAVTNGYFQQLLDFGPNIPRGIRIWLEITIKKYNTAETPALLAPRQELTPAPIALYAQKAHALAGDLPMINHVIRLDVEGRGTFFFDRIINFDPQIQKISYVDPGTGQTHWNPGGALNYTFQLVRYATDDRRFWEWKDELMEDLSAQANCNLYIIDTRTGRTIDAWHFIRVYPQQFLLEPDDQTQAKSVVEKITFDFQSMHLLETGTSVGWERPPVPTIKLPATLILLPSQEEQFDSFTNLGWEIIRISDPISYHFEFEVLLPSFYRASAGSSYIANLFEAIDSGDPWERQRMVLPLYDSHGELVFAIEMAECWPFEVKKYFYNPKDIIMEKISFAIEDISYSQ